MTTATDSALARPALAGSLDLAPAISQAVALGKDGVEVLERLHAIHKEERAHAARAAFADAMHALKSELPPVIKSVAGMHGASRAGTRTKGMYAPLDTICAVLDPLCAKHGFSYRFPRQMRDGKEWVVCVVTHRGGHSEETPYPAMDDEPGKGKTPLHARGSGDTYARRYALTAAFSIVTADPDDDGAAFNRREEREPGDDYYAPTGAPSEAAEKAAANIQAMLDTAPDPKAEKAALLAWCSERAGREIKRLSDLAPAALAGVAKAVEAKSRRGWTQA